MAGQQIIVKVAVDASQMTKQLDKAKRSGKDFERSFGTTMRGVCLLYTSPSPRDS